MLKRLLGREIRPAWFCAGLVAIGLLLFALPYPTPGDALRVAHIKTTHAPVVIVGPSTIDYVSECDQDHRTVPDIFSSITGKPMLDLSIGGQPLIDSINLSAISNRSAAITDIILPLAYTQSDDWTTPPYRKLLSYKAMAPQFQVYAAADAATFLSGLRDDPRRLEQHYRYQGQDFADYRVLAAKQFAREKSLQGCPETFTHDLAFTRGYFWWTHVAVRPNPVLPALLADLNRDAAAHGKRLHVVMLPVNLRLIRQLDAGWADVVVNNQKRLYAELRGRQIDVLDLTDQFQPDEFSGQWCACTHLRAAGRVHLAQAIAKAFSTPSFRGPPFSAPATAPGAVTATEAGKRS